MEFDNAFEVPLPPEQAWPVLMNIQGIAPCMPGAQLTEVVDDKTYKGNIAVRLGPVALTFAGVVKFEEIDNANHTARVRAQGNDAKGRGSAQAAATFRLEPSAAGSKVLVHTDLTLSGAVAQYGRGVGMIQATASALMNQFANNLKKQLADPAGRDATRRAKPISATSLAGQVVVEFHQGQARRKVIAMAGSADNDPVILVDADDVAGRHRRQARRAPARPQAPRHLGAGAQRQGRVPAAAAQPGQISLRRTVDQRLLQPSAAGRKPPPTPRAAGSRRRWASPARSSRCSSIQYNTPVPGGLIENEVVHVFGGRHDGADQARSGRGQRVEVDRAIRRLIADMRAAAGCLHGLVPAIRRPSTAACSASGSAARGLSGTVAIR